MESPIAAARVHARRGWIKSRLELASYSHDERKDLGFAADLDAEIAKPFWKK